MGTENPFAAANSLNDNAGQRLDPLERSYLEHLLQYRRASIRRLRTVAILVHGCGILCIAGALFLGLAEQISHVHAVVALLCAAIGGMLIAQARIHHRAIHLRSINEMILRWERIEAWHEGNETALYDNTKG